MSAPGDAAADNVVAQQHVSPFLTDSWNVDRTALVILNAPIPKQSPIFAHLWDCASFRVCADGGANRLYRHACNDDDDDGGNGSSKNCIPDLITGDLDSLRPHVRRYYEDQGVTIAKVHNQDANDLEKSLDAVVARGKHDTCLIYGAFGGRLDQEMASLQMLFSQQRRMSHLWLYNDANAALLLQPGPRHELHFPNYAKGDDDASAAAADGADASTSPMIMMGEGPTCGLIPLGGACESVTTAGLQWNLDGDRLEFGGLVSTSNRLVSAKVEISTSHHPLLFTVEMQRGISNDDGGFDHEDTEEVW